MANLDLIIGPMFAGKSCELIKRARVLNVINRKYIMVKPIIDNRYSESSVVSHDNERINCISLTKLSDIFTGQARVSYLLHIKNDSNVDLPETSQLQSDIDLTDIDTILIDEGQFFSDLKEVVLYLVEKLNINVIISGLDGDSSRHKFGQILDLIPFSTNCIKLNALCIKCLDGTLASFTHRKVLDNNQIVIGASELYMSLCRDHYLQAVHNE